MKKMILIGFAGSLSLLVVFVGIWGFQYGFRWFTAEPRGALEQREITTRGAFRIQEYERFYRLKEEVDSTDTKLAALPSELDVRQRTECTGLLAVRANRVAEYNAASAAELTRGKWKADDLPQRLNQENTRKC